MIISRDFGGLGFSAYAHSEIVRRISTRSIALGVTTMVPNSLVPGELLHLFGTDKQQNHWLPRLARGAEVPAFALTSEKAGSDASAMIDSGIVCVGESVDDAPGSLMLAGFNNVQFPTSTRNWHDMKSTAITRPGNPG